MSEDRPARDGSDTNRPTGEDRPEPTEPTEPTEPDADGQRRGSGTRPREVRARTHSPEQAGAGGESVTPVRRRLVYAEFGIWVGLLTAALAVVATVVGVAAGGLAAGGLGVAKTILFVLGFLLFGLGAIELRPPPAWKDEKRFSLAPSGESRVDRLVRRLPPLNGRAVPAGQRIGRGTKWFAAGLLVLVVSYAMEALLGAGVGA